MIELVPGVPAPSRVSADSRLRSPQRPSSLSVLGVSSIALWRAYTGSAPETDRAVASRQLQARAAQASEQLVEKTKGLEATQQESIDQLQMVQDQLQTVRRLLAAQQTDYQEAFRAGRNADGSGRGLAAILCQRASLRTSAAPASRTRSAGQSSAQTGARTAARAKRAADQSERRLAMKSRSAG